MSISVIQKHSSRMVVVTVIGDLMVMFFGSINLVQLVRVQKHSFGDFYPFDNN